VSVGINLLKLGLEMAKVDPTFEGSVAIVAQLAYLQSLETVLGRIQDEATQAMKWIPQTGQGAKL
jgi:hypothetical protein